MPRIIKSIFAFFIISVCLTPAALAAGNAEYRIDELGMTVSIPDNYLTFTRDVDQNDPLVQELGYDAQALIDFFESKYIYLDAVAPDFSHEYSVKMHDIGNAEKPDDFNLYTDDALLNMKDYLVEGLLNAGGSNITLDIYHHSQTKFYLVQFIQVVDSVTTFTEMYCTFADGKPISIILDSYEQIYSDAQEETLRSIVDSIRFDRVASGLFSITKTGFYIFGFNINKVVGGTTAAAIVGGIVGLIIAVSRKSARHKAAAGAAGYGAPGHHDQYPPVNMPYEGPQYRPPSQDEFSTIHEQVICPNCLSSNWSGRTVCTECGARLEK